MNRLAIVIILGWVGTAPTARSATVGMWESATGFPTSSAPPELAFVTAHDEGTGIGNFNLGGPLTVFLFSFTNNHPSAFIGVDQLSFTLSGTGVAVGVSIGQAPDLFEQTDLVLTGSDTVTLDRPTSQPASLFDVGPGETFYAAVHSLVGAEPFQVNNATITAIPEPSALLLGLLGFHAWALRRRRGTHRI